MKERYNTSKVFKQRKLIWNFKFYTDTAAIFSQMNEAFRVKRFVETSKRNLALVFAIIRYQCALVFASAFVLYFGWPI